MKIYKFPLVVTDEQHIRIGESSKILSCQFQNNTLCLWALCDPDAAFIIARKVRIIGTGNPMPDMTNFNFVATVQERQFVWHVFVEKES